MSKTVSMKMCKSPNNSMWNEAIKDAEQQLKIAKARVAGLEMALRTCRDRVKAGESWPGKHRGVVRCRNVGSNTELDQHPLLNHTVRERSLGVWL